MRFFLITVLLLVSSLCFGQRHNVYFLKYNGNYVKTRDSADYIRIVAEPDSGSKLYNVADYYMNGQRKLVGKSSTIIPIILEGFCTTFYGNGNKQTVATYDKGNLSGMRYDFYPNGKLYRSINYEGDNKVTLRTTKIIAEYDSTGNALVQEGNGYYKEYAANFRSFVEQGKVKDGNKDGIWRGIDDNIAISYEEIYTDGKLVSGKSVGRAWDTVSYTVQSVQPQYTGGLKAFYQYLSSNIVYPTYERAHNISGRVVLTFVVEKNGELSHIRIIQGVTDNINKEAIRVLSKSTNWQPGTMYGRLARVQYTIPFSFGLTN